MLLAMVSSTKALPGNIPFACDCLGNGLHDFSDSRNATNSTTVEPSYLHRSNASPHLHSRSNPGE